MVATSVFKIGALSLLAVAPVSKWCSLQRFTVQLLFGALWTFKPLNSTKKDREWQRQKSHVRSRRPLATACIKQEAKPHKNGGDTIYRGDER